MPDSKITQRLSFSRQTYKKIASGIAVCAFTWVVFSTLSPSAKAEETPLWSTVDDWDIRVDRTLGNGCFASAIYEEGTYFRIGINNTDDEPDGYFMFGNESWKSLEAGKEYDFKYSFGNEAPWDGSAVGIDMGDNLVMLYQIASEADLFEEFMRKTSMKIEYQGNVIEHLTLRGSHKAFNEVIECQRQVNEAMSSQESDPFASSSSKGKKDPFSY